jgi:hypothetical protein
MRTKRHKRRRVRLSAYVEGPPICSNANCRPTYQDALTARIRQLLRCLPDRKQKEQRTKRKGVPFSTPHLASDLHFVYNNPQTSPRRESISAPGAPFLASFARSGVLGRHPSTDSTGAHLHPSVHHPRPTHAHRHRNSAHCGNHLRNSVPDIRPKSVAAPPAAACSVADATILAHTHPSSRGSAIPRNSATCGSSSCHSHRRSVPQLQLIRCAKVA